MRGWLEPLIGITLFILICAIAIGIVKVIEIARGIEWTF